ncbi:MAG: hypothetical protein ACI4LH_04755, partial [Candidatus Heritagella sp.]
MFAERKGVRRGIVTKQEEGIKHNGTKENAIKSIRKKKNYNRKKNRSNKKKTEFLQKNSYNNMEKEGKEIPTSKLWNKRIKINMDSQCIIGKS